MLDRERWGKLGERYLEVRPRKLLALDGGGVRGVMSLQILGRLEELLASETGRGATFRLCDYFDYIGGTNTGAIIAAGLVRGMSVADGGRWTMPRPRISKTCSGWAARPVNR
jgi:predicted acylesterase/phospholipase RssA